MTAVCRRYLKSILALILTVQAICLCCVCSACTTVNAESYDDAVSQPLTGEISPAENYSRWLREHYSSDVATRAEWLSELTSILGLTPGTTPSDAAELFASVQELGLTDSREDCPYTALTRGYVASTMFKALGYHEHRVDTVADVDDDDAAMLTLVYYGYFIPDAADCVYPDAVVGRDEFASLIEEVRRYARLKGKRLLSFGDSIMFGVGNGCCGISDMIAEKYGMTDEDYSYPRATIGVNGENSHVADQVREAALLGESADLILLNGGTNDMLHVELGKMGQDFELTSFDETTFIGGMETSLALIRKFWGDVPVLYVRAHNMDVCDDETERLYGEYALKVAEKWSIYTADIYEDTDFNSENETIRDRYTYYKEQILRSDSIHPTASGYAKYYLPLVCAKVSEILTGKGFEDYDEAVYRRSLL